MSDQKEKKFLELERKQQKLEKRINTEVLSSWKMRRA